MKSGELAKRTGVSADTLHHYEKMGLLTPAEKQDNGYRHYEENAVQRVQLIQRALRMGFALSELAPILKERDGGGAPCKEVRKMAGVKLEEIDLRLKELNHLRAQFASMIDDWDDALKNANGKPARLLDRLPTFDTDSTVPRKRPGRSRP